MLPDIENSENASIITQIIYYTGSLSKTKGFYFYFQEMLVILYWPDTEYEEHIVLLVVCIFT